VGASVERSLTIRLKIASDQFDAAMLAKGVQVKVLAAELSKVGKSSGSTAGSDFVGSFQTAVKSKLDAAIKSLPKVELKADASDADRRVAQLRRNLETLQKAIEIRGADQGALNAIRHVQSELDKLQHRDNRVDVRVNAGAASAELAALDAQLKSLGQIEVEAKRATDLGIKPLRDSILLLGPALLPVSAAVAAGVAGLVGAGAAGVLAVKGVSNEMKAGTPLGQRYSAGLTTINGDLHTLEATAARGVLGGFQRSIADVDQRMPKINGYVGVLSGQLGDVEQHTLHGLVGGLDAFEPVIAHVVGYLDSLSARWDAFVNGAGGKKLADGLGREFDQVVPMLESVLTTIGKLINAAGPFGGEVVGGLKLLSDVINAIPEPILQAVVTSLLALRGAAAVHSVLDGISGRLRNVAAESEAANGGVTRLSKSASGLSRLAAGTAIIGALGIGIAQTGFALSGYIERNNSFVKAMNDSKQAEQSFATALQASKGQLDAGVQSAVQYQLQQTGIAGKAAKAGISLGQLSAGVTGNTADFQKLIQTWKAAGASNDAVMALGLLYAQFQQTRVEQQKYLDGQLQLAQSQPYVWGVQKTTADSLATVASMYHLTQDTASKYAGVLGITNDEVASGAVDNRQLAQAVLVVGKNLADASQSGQDYLDAVAKFAASGGTAADRAALIGATLKAANGDALGYASAMAGASAANQQFVTDFDQTRTDVAKAGHLFDALHGGVVDLTSGTINYRNAAAAPLIADLQSMQDAAMKAAQATYQHGAATDKAKASSDAYNLYVAQTRDALIGEAKQLGLTKGQATKLADTYFGMPSDVKTQIEAIGTDPVVQILDRIGGLLAKLVGQPWTFQVAADDQASQVIRQIQSKVTALNGTTAVVHVATVTAGGAAYGGQQVLDNGGPGASGPGGKVPAHAAGGGAADGWGTTGERGWELFYKSGSTLHFFPHEQSTRMLPGGPSIPAYASGTDAFDGVYAPVAKSRKARSGKGLSARSQAAIRKQIVSVQFKVENSDLDRLRAAIASGTAGSIRTAMASLIADVHNAALKGLGSEAVIPALRRGAAELENYANRKAAVAKQLKAADAQLVAAEKQYADEQKAAAAAVMGTFDAGTAGNGTYGSLMATLNQSVDQAETFEADIRSLTGRLNKTALAQAEGEGPAQAGANLHALATATPDQIAAYNAQYTRLQQLSQQVGTASADSLYKAGVDTAEGLVRGLESQEAAIAKAMSKIAASLVAQIRNDLQIHSPSRVMHDLFAHAGEGAELGVLSREANVRAAGSRLAHAVAVSPAQLAYAAAVPHASPAGGQGIDYRQLAAAMAEALGEIPVTGEIQGGGLAVNVSRTTARRVRK
jgi:hypothetical protein